MKKHIFLRKTAAFLLVLTLVAAAVPLFSACNRDLMPLEFTFSEAATTVVENGVYEVFVTVRNT